ncbi:hypothetical protein AtNW77_Chr2g0265331 [Arabidopsis thaliana]|uniref:Uncharacterized protein n=1 Tax=Arabidopsis thaliana TaxID=3702 RepID=A0A1P8B188_ARATH|nr:uncharacterized protein AT2G42865 [Arabidopsis thaliana]ANM62651.1 hypothetical protein AT2G42865 [Arabidopsis thaliana]|eukprot:NP_001324793.1 hypothetical protein AT2G42865 [Arabidopsis thaliana]
MRSLEVEMKQRCGEMEIEMKQIEEEKKRRDETVTEVAELKKWLMEKGDSFESYEKEVESLTKVRSDIEKRFRGIASLRGSFE